MPARFDLERFPRIPLGHGPTPLERLARLSDHLGIELWVKRDDCTGLALGGNKVRKLEYLLGEARADRADTIITVGGVQSNHARQTAAAAARLGMHCELVLPRLVERYDNLYENNGNLLLDRMFGAQVHIVDDSEAAAVKVGALAEEAAQRGGKAVFFPSGGSTPVGALGYVRAALELREQCKVQNIEPTRIVVAASTGGTQAGLITGLEVASTPTRVTGIAVYDDASATTARVLTLLRDTADLLAIDPPAEEAVEVLLDPSSGGYGVPTPPMREALETTARLEGLLLDPVYSGKAMAGLFTLVRRRQIAAGQTVVFWHTGGVPALFAYG